MIPNNLVQELERIKKENSELMEIVIFDEEGHVIESTQEDEFKAYNRFYALPATATKLISKSHEQKSRGITLEMEETEFYLRYSMDSEEDDWNKIIALEYEPNGLDRGSRKRIVHEISELMES